MMVGRYYKLDTKLVEGVVRGGGDQQRDEAALLRAELGKKLDADVDRDTRCMVCGSTRPNRMVRVESREVGGEGQWDDRLVVQVRYCADDARCGEAEAMALLDLLEAPFKTRQGEGDDE